MRLADVLWRPATRSFIVASTRAGKSTFASAGVDLYHARYRADQVVILDPKRRYFPAPDKREARIFPHGYRSVVYRGQRGVFVNASLVTRGWGFRYNKGQAILIQDKDLMDHYFEWLYRHSKWSEKRLVFSDETFGWGGPRGNPGFRRLMQEGGERGVGMLNINQRPRGLESTILSEAEQVYVGHVRKGDDRLFLSQNLDVDGRLPLLPPYHWLLVDQAHPARSSKKPFSLGDSYK